MALQTIEQALGELMTTEPPSVCHAAMDYLVDHGVEL